MSRGHAIIMLALASIVLGGAVASCKGSAGGGGGGIKKTVVLGKSAGSGGTAAPAMPGKNVPAIKVDTVGYPPAWPKIVIFNVEPKNARVVDAKGAVALTIAADKVSARGVDKASLDPVWQVDISELKKPGTYTIENDGGASGAAKSDPFVVGDTVYDEAVVAGIKSFYFQRTRTALPKPFAIWKGDAYTRDKPSHAHADVGWDLEDYPAKKRKWKMEAGWFDAGNFDMYVPSTAPAAQELMLAYEWAPKSFDDSSLNIPESGNGIPDILDETRWGLLWVLSMQEDGGAFRSREAVMEWSPEGPADQDTTVRWVAGVSSAGTAKAIAALAMASRIYAPFDKAFAKRCGDAARKAWTWMLENPKRVIPDGKGSEQPLWDDEPENTDVGARFIAAVEMWRTFRDAGARAKAQELMAAPETQADQILNGAWANVSRWGLATLAFDEQTPKALRDEARKRILASVDALEPRVEREDGYRSIQAIADYYWASNSQLMEKTHVLSVAARLDPQQSWLREAARDQWHWVLGRNPNGYSMVTRVGKGPTRLYHMEWGHKEPPPPGFLVGGPNYMDMPFLAPNAPAKAILWDNPNPLRSGLKAHELWHWQQSDLWDSGFIPDEEWGKGWWTVIEPDILYSAAYVLAGATVR